MVHEHGKYNKQYVNGDCWRNLKHIYYNYQNHGIDEIYDSLTDERMYGITSCM